MNRIQLLATELRAAITSVPGFDDRIYEVFDVDDFKARLAGNLNSGAGIGFMREEPTPRDNDQKSGASALAAAMVDTVFGILYYTPYTNETPTPAFYTATDLADQVRSVVQGRPSSTAPGRSWKYLGFSPVDWDADGTVYYLQTWVIRLPVIGNVQ